MARPTRFPRELLLHAATALASDLGPQAVTMSGVAKAVGAPSGSVYHRFEGRASLLAEVWLELVDGFQQAWWSEASGEQDPGVVSTITVRWARDHQAEARVLLLHRATDFLSGDLGEGNRARAQQQRASLERSFALLSERFLGEVGRQAVERTQFALASIPVAAVRGPLGSRTAISTSIERLVHEAATSLLGGHL